MAMIFGIGVGLFVRGMIWGAALLLCIVLSRASGGIKFGAIGIVVLAIVITITLVLFPKEPLEPQPTEVKKTDPTFISRVIMLAVLGLFTLISFFCMFLYHWMEPILAKPIKTKRF